MREPPDIQDQLAEHMRCTAERDRLAHQAKAHFDAGELEKAKAALEKAEACHLRLREIEATSSSSRK
jgi:hypothetical protein